MLGDNVPSFASSTCRPRGLQYSNKGLSDCPAKMALALALVAQVQAAPALGLALRLQAALQQAALQQAALQQAALQQAALQQAALQQAALQWSVAGARARAWLGNETEGSAWGPSLQTCLHPHGGSCSRRRRHIRHVRCDDVGDPLALPSRSQENPARHGA